MASNTIGIHGSREPMSAQELRTQPGTSIDGQHRATIAPSPTAGKTTIELFDWLCCV